MPGLTAVVRLALALACLIHPAHADDQSGNTVGDGDRHYEVWAGADAAENVWLLYSGTTLAPFSDIHQEGLRLRFVGGYGKYRYAYTDSASGPKHFNGRSVFADALVGYLWRLDPLIVKLFGGVSHIDHQIRPVDPESKVQGPDFGAKAVAEFWYNIGELGFASVDLAWSQAHNTSSARARFGYRLMPNFSIGPEAVLNLDRQGVHRIDGEDLNFKGATMDYGRIGLFARSEWYGGELSASGGIVANSRDEPAVYGTMNWITQF